jgi:hypothetical protein
VKALIKLGQIVQVSKESFDVHPDYQWVDCPDDCSTLWTYDDGLFLPPEPEKPFVDPNEILNKKINAMWVYCDTGDKSAINAVKIEEAKVVDVLEPL